MNRRLTLVFAMTAILLGSTLLMAHDDKIHKATIGEVTAATADGLDLKTKTGVVKVKYSSKTTFELKEKPAAKADVKVGDRVGVIGNKLPTGEIMANDVILGVSTQTTPAAKKDDHKH